MTTYAPTFTPRYRAGYIVAGIAHTITVRGARGGSFSAMEAARVYIAEVFDAVHGDMCSDLAFTSGEVALTDSDVFLPALAPDLLTAGGNSISDYSAIDKISAMTVTGKSQAGKARFSLYGLLFLGSTPGDIGADGLVRPAELGGLATIVGIANTRFYGSDGTAAAYHTVATFKPNDHLLKLVRKGTIS
jgi:hypothetical protein